MPTSRSAKKRLRQNIARRLHNRTIRSAVRNQVKKVRRALEASDADEAQSLFPATMKKLDQAAAKGVIHANAAARTKSRLASQIKSLQASA